MKNSTAWLSVLLPISIKIFKVSYFENCGDNISDLENLPDMEDRLRCQVQLFPRHPSKIHQVSTAGTFRVADSLGTN